MSDPDELLADIGEAVAGMDDRLAAVEAAVVTAWGEHGTPAAPSRRRPLRSRSTESAWLRKARQRRDDAGRITWTVWNLDELTPQQREKALGQLREFVDWLNREYQIPRATLAITPCWYHHPGVVRELWALLASYQYAYSARFMKDVTLPSDSPVLWHERSLWPCLRRLREEHGLQECAAGNRHTPQVQSATSTDDGFTRAAVTKLAAEWTKPHGPPKSAGHERVAAPDSGRVARRTG